jgi:hypothetical protein
MFLESILLLSLAFQLDFLLSMLQRSMGNMLYINIRKLRRPEGAVSLHSAYFGYGNGSMLNTNIMLAVFHLEVLDQHALHKPISL